MPSAQQLLSCALTYRESEERTTPISLKFETEEEAIGIFTEVLLHEAKNSLSNAIPAPENPYLYPVDVDTTEPGIVDSRNEFHVLRGTANMARVSYKRMNKVSSKEQEELPTVVNTTLEKAEKEAKADKKRELKREERKAETVSRNEEKREERKRERANETPEEKEERLREGRQKREERKRKKNEEGERDTKVSRQKPLETESEECILVPDHSSIEKKKAKKRGLKATFFQTPVPHHRHLYGLQRASLSKPLSSAILGSESSDALEIISGPPGTGKTFSLVERVPSAGRVIMCAPTNVGAVNLFMRCIRKFPTETSLVLPPERVPTGTPLVSNDPTKRVVCTTVSSRGGRFLDSQLFENVFLDEAGQCMEAWVWTLLREDVERLCMAGDVCQLPALVCQSGELLGHGRSLMERLLQNGYPSTNLTVQNRMAPEILRLTNSLAYGNLECGSYAPTRGQVTWIQVNGTEQEVDHSFANAEEVSAAERIVEEMEEEDKDKTVILCPYAAQCRLMLSKKMGVQVCTVDSFQGKEMEHVLLSVVRTGHHGMGFWEDKRRIVVAFTRARTRLFILHSPDVQGEIARMSKI